MLLDLERGLIEELMQLQHNKHMVYFVEVFIPSSSKLKHVLSTVHTHEAREQPGD